MGVKILVRETAFFRGQRLKPGMIVDLPGDSLPAWASAAPADADEIRRAADPVTARAWRKSREAAAYRAARPAAVQAPVAAPVPAQPAPPAPAPGFLARAWSRARQMLGGAA